ncbi:MAG: hypothetical protein U0X20_16640 [Caldilineaceae bacterium]
MSATKKSVSLFASAAVFCVMFCLAIMGLQGVSTAHAAGAEQWESGGLTAPSTVYTVTYVIAGPTGGVGVHNNAK